MYQVYRIVNLINDKVYIGRSKDAKKRFKSHEYTANGGRGYKLHAAIRKYGILNFKMDILTSHDNIEDCVKKEEYFIKIHSSYKNGYNSSRGGFGELRSEESYKTQSDNMKGRVFSEEHKKNISKSMSGRKLSLDTRLNMIKPLNRDQWNKGKKLSEAQKEKLQGAKRRPSHMIQVGNYCTFFSIKYAAEYLNTRPSNITRWLNKDRKNTSKYELQKIGEIILYNYKINFLYINKEII